MELTIEETRHLRSIRHPFNSVVYVVYNVITDKLDKIFRSGNEAFKYVKTKQNLKLVNISNNIHCPRHIYLDLTPFAQLDFYLDGYLHDELTEKHKRLREKLKWKN